MKILLLLTIALASLHIACTQRRNDDGKSNSSNYGNPVLSYFEPVQPKYQTVVVTAPDIVQRHSGHDNTDFTTSRLRDVSLDDTTRRTLSQNQWKNTINAPTTFPSPKYGRQDNQIHRTGTPSFNYPYNTTTESTTPRYLLRSRTATSLIRRNPASTPVPKNNPSSSRFDSSSPVANSVTKTRAGTAAIHEFDLRFSKAFFKQNTLKQNTVLSTVSVQVLIGILGEASLRNEKRSVASLTTSQLVAFDPEFKEDISLKEYRKYFKTIVGSFKEPSKYFSLNFGTRVYMLPRIKPSDKFKQLVSNIFDATFGEISDNSENTAKDINAWVKNVTNNKILQLVDSSSLKSSVVLLLNAVYFKGLWKYPFENTLQMEFNSESGQIAMKPSMQQKNTFNYAYFPEMNVRIIQLPYEGNKFSMFILLPFENDGIDQLIHDIDVKKFDILVKDMEETIVNVTLPKFRIDSNLNLNNVVKELGITEIFSDSAEFPQFTSGEQTSQIKVSSIIQKAGIVVDEKGTEAQAATEIELVDKFGGDPRQFIADHPFVFFIQDDTTQARLFSGIVYDPVY